MKITIASGKGGTGKTTLAVNLAAYFSQVKNEATHLIDCDVDAANAHLFIEDAGDQSAPALVRKPVVNEALCTGCGKCREACHYNAITILAGTPLIFDEMCHGCGACEYVCPEHAISYTKKAIGAFHYMDQTNLGFKLSWGDLNIGEVQAPDMIRQLKQIDSGSETYLYDASPGAGCPVRESMIGSDVVLLVTEPTPFGLNDLKMAAALAGDLGLPAAIVINRSRGQDEVIDTFAREFGLPVIGRIPFRREYAESISNGRLRVGDYPDMIEVMKEIEEALRKLIKDHTVRSVRINGSTTKEIYEPAHESKNRSVREFVIMSGKGGTGKTTLSAALAGLTKGSILFDADVDASNLPILLKGARQSEKRFLSGQKAVINPQICAQCNACITACHFNAISEGPRIIPEACEGCAFCTMVCPEHAITMKTAETGYVYLSDSPAGPISHAFLNIGEENSGKLVTQVREQAFSISNRESIDQILGDGPPGTGCPVIAATTGADLALIVTEPGLSGIHDMTRAIKLAKHFELQVLVVINKSDINRVQNQRIHDICEQEKVTILGEIPFDETVEKALNHEKSIIEFSESRAAVAIMDIYQQLQQTYGMK